jgi:hypothetical protein
VSKTKAFRRIGPKTLPGGNPENGDLKTLINKQLKIQNITGSRVVSAMDLTMRGFEVRHTANLKSGKCTF